MLRIDHEPIETRARDHLNRVIVRERAPQADLSMACLQRTLECIDRQLHQWDPDCQMNCAETPPRGPKSPWTVSPLFAHIGRVKDPDNTRWPASSTVPNGPTLL